MRNKLMSIFGPVIKLTDTLTVETEKLAELFTECESCSYSELKRVDTKNGYGYGKYIDEWREKGLVE